MHRSNEQPIDRRLNEAGAEVEVAGGVGLEADLQATCAFACEPVDGFGRADQRGGIAGCAGGGRQWCPQGAVVALAGSGRRQQPLRTGILWSPIGAIADVTRRELTRAALDVGL